MPLPYTHLPTRTSSDYNVPSDINQLQENIDAIIGNASAPVDTIYNLQAVLADTRTNWVPNGAVGSSVAPLVAGKIPSTYIPAVAISEWLGEFASLVLALADPGVQASQRGDWLSVTGVGSYIVITDSPTVAGDLKAIIYPSAPVQSVNGQTGVVSIDFDTLPEAGVPTYRKFKFLIHATDPGPNDDDGSGVNVRDIWFNSNTLTMFQCYSNASMNAVWRAFETRNMKGAVDGYGSLDGTGKQPLSELPSHASTHEPTGSDPLEPQSIGLTQTLVEMVSADGGSIVEGHVLRIAGDGTVARAIASSVENARVLGLAWSGPVTIGNPVRVATQGEFAMADWTSVTGSATLTPGARYWLDPDNAGQLITTFRMPNVATSVLVGVALDTLTLNIRIGNPFGLYNT